MKLPFMVVWERFPTAIKIDRIPLFDVSRPCHGHGVIGRSMFDVQLLYAGRKLLSTLSLRRRTAASRLEKASLSIVPKCLA